MELVKPVAALGAGRDLDALVAGRVMGWHDLDALPYGMAGAVWLHGHPPGEGGALRCDVPHYSTDITAAWRVVEEMQRRFRTPRAGANREWAAFVRHIDGAQLTHLTASGAAHVICVAAVLAAAPEVP